LPSLYATIEDELQSNEWTRHLLEERDALAKALAALVARLDSAACAGIEKDGGWPELKASREALAWKPKSPTPAPKESFLDGLTK
jgi:hypothetical protein